MEFKTDLLKIVKSKSELILISTIVSRSYSYREPPFRTHYSLTV